METRHEARADVPVAFRIAAYGTLAFFTAFTTLPLVWLCYTSFKPQSEILANVLALPVNWTVDNYVQAWSLSDFPHLFFNSILYSVVTTALVVALSVSAGFAFAKIPSRLTPLWYAFILLGLLVTISSSIVPIFVAETLLGLTNTRAGIIIPYVAFNLSFAIYLAAAYIRSIEQEIIEAAKIDGAGYLTMYWQIILPNARPIIATISIFTFHACWVEYVLVYMISSDDSIRTVQVGVNMLNGQLTFNYGFLFAAIVIATAPLLVLYAVFRRQLQAGFSMGSVKG
jgi:raffinose/stachyose/melibiose transport system permease protein